MIMTIMILRKIRAATLGKVKPLVPVNLTSLVKQRQQVTKQLPGYTICQPLLPAEIESPFPPPMSPTLKEGNQIQCSKLPRLP